MIAIALAWLALLIGCSAAPAQAIEVYAASSLVEVFGDLEREFEREHPATDVVITYAGSQTLRLQIEHGAMPDAFATANPEHLRALSTSERVGPAEPFATNTMALAVRTTNTSIVDLNSLANARRIVIGTPAVPVGAYARQVLDRLAAVDPDAAARIRTRIVSEENNARLTRAKVSLGEADAAFVYLTDALHAKDVRLVRIPAEFNVDALYAAAIVGESRQGRAWVQFLRSDASRAILKRHGFGAPP